jgi:hypothetical protein
MDTSAIAGQSLLMKTAQTHQVMSLSMIKEAADQQKQIANLLAQNAVQIQQTSAQRDNFAFSIYV